MITGRGRERWVRATAVLALCAAAVATAPVWGQPALGRVARGAIHIHSVYSDGSGDLPHIIREAQAAGLDFIIMSDHNTLQPRRDGYEGQHGRVLVLIGVEISTSAGHYLAMNVPSDFRWPSQQAQAVIEAVNRAGGMGFIAHPVSRWEWKDWGVTGFTGLEVANQSSFVHRAFERQPLRLTRTALRSVIRDSGKAILEQASRARPQANLEAWSEEIQKRGARLVIIGSVDAHALVQVGSRRLKIPPYRESFESLQTHVITAAPLTRRDVARDRALIYDAIRQGHCYVIYAIRGKALGFWYSGSNGQQRALMGDELALRGGVSLEAVVPPHTEPTVIRLYRDGQQIKSVHGDILRSAVGEPGAYHVEVHIAKGDQRWPWIISNPIYVTR